MKEYKYKVTVNYLEDPEGNKPNCPPLVFEATNHDDLLKIIKNTKEAGGVLGENAAPLVVGLKLFSAVILKNKDFPLFASLKPNLAEIIKTIKSQIKM